MAVGRGPPVSLRGAASQGFSEANDAVFWAPLTQGHILDGSQ